MRNSTTGAIRRAVVSLVLALALTLSATSCDRSSSSRDAAVATPDVDSAGADVLGHYTWGAEVRSFAPCASSLVYWVDGSEAVLTELARRYDELASSPYEPMHARLLGAAGARAADGFAADYDGVFRVDSILELRRITPADCAPRTQ